MLEIIRPIRSIRGRCYEILCSGLFVEFVGFVDGLFREFHAAFEQGHCTDELWPVAFGEPFSAAEACEPA